MRLTFVRWETLLVVATLLITSAAVPIAAFASVIPGAQKELEDINFDPHFPLGIPIKVQVVQTSTALVIDGAVAWWKRALDNPRAYWDVALYVHSEAPQAIAAYEFRVIMLNASGQRLTEYTAAVTKPLLPVDKPGPPRQWDDLGYPQRGGGVFEHITLGDSAGALIKLSVKRIKFADGSTWVE